MKVKVKKLRRDATVPSRGSVGAAAFDLYSLAQISIPSKSWAKIQLGIAMEIPKGYYGQILPRSGLAARHQIAVMGGVIDSDYRGELMVMLYNHSNEFATLPLRSRVAQMAIIPVPPFELEEVDDLDDTERGEGGFGSTGV